MTQTLRYAAAITLATLSVATSATAQVLTTYTNGDVFVGFRQSGTANTLAVNLGSATKFLLPAYGGTATPGVPFKVQFGVRPGTSNPVTNLSADLNTVFGATWANNTDDGSGVRWAVVGLSGNTTSGIAGYTARTLFVTRARTAPNEPTVIGADRLDIGDFGEFSAAFTAFTQGSGGSQFRFQQSTTNSTVAYIGAASGPDNWGTRIDTASEGSFGLGSGVEVEQTFGNFQGTTDSVLDLWISPNTGSTAIPVNQNTYLGSFTLNNAGELTFTPASPAVKPVVTNATRSGTKGAPFDFQIAANNSPTSYNATGLPAGLSVNTTTGLISGTPTQAGTFAVSLFASNSAGTGTGTLTLSIADLPPVVSDVTRSATVGTLFSFTIIGNNSPTSYNATGLPAGLSVNTTTGLISGTPTAAGTFPVTISATNSGGTGSATLTLTIASEPVAAPIITSNPIATAKVGEFFTYQITASNNPASFNATGLPSGLSINTATGVVSGTPTAAGTPSITISATNAGGTGTATLALTILPAAPVITSSTNTTAKINEAFAYQITASNSPASFNATGLPSGLSVNSATGVITGTPTQTGTFNVAISASNAGGTGTATLVLNIPVPASITSGNFAGGQVGLSFAFQITASNNPTSFAVNGLLPAGLALNTTTGLISGTPTTAGNFTVTVSATNAGGTGSATLTFNVSPSPAPVVTSSTQNGRVGLALAFVIEATNAPQSYAARGLPAGLTINARTGQISGTPTQSGTFSVAISATNSTGIGTGTLTLNIAARPAPAVASETLSGRVALNFWYQIKASEAPLSYAAQNLPAGLTVNRTTGVITGTPTVAGTFNIAISATNATGTGTGTLTLNIAQQPAPIVTPASVTGRIGLAFGHQVVASNAPRTFAAQGLPAGLTLNASTGRISGTPTRAGTFNVTISATNSGGTGRGTLTLTIAAPPQLPVITRPAAPLIARTRQAFNYQVSASNTPTSFRAGSGAWPIWLRLNAATGVVSGTPATRGNFSFTVIAANAGGSSVPVTIRINVQ